MDGFKKLPKQIACFKEGGSIQRSVENFTKRDRKEIPEADVKQDKKIVKKAFGIHDAQLHDGEKTDLSNLKKGGRAKKAMGTVKKYKAGGSVDNEYSAKKSSGDLDNIEKVKNIKAGKADAPNAATKRPNFKGSDVAKTNKLPAGSSKAKKVSEGPKEANASSGAKGGPNKYKSGGKIKKMATGGPSFETDPAAAQAALDTQDNIATRNMVMNPARKAKKFIMDKLSGLNPMNAATSNVGAAPAPAMQAPMAPTAPGAAPVGPTSSMVPAQKRGGKVKRK